jgi:hypothetical protein
MRDFGEYLRAYRAYVLANLGWRKALMGALVWLAGMFAPLWAKAFVQLPNWVAITWCRIVLAAAYAEQSRTQDTARVVTTIHRFDPTFEPTEFGTKFLNSADLEHLRDGLHKAGLLTDEAGRAR